MNLLWIRIIAGLLVLAAIVGLYRWWAEGLREEGRIEVRAAWAQERKAQKDAALKQAAANAAETARRLKAQKDAQDETARQLSAARRDAAAARTAADGLRVRLAEFSAAARGAPGNPAPSFERASAGIEVLAELLTDVEAEGRAMAEEADRARISGLQCQRSYEALSQ